MIDMELKLIPWLIAALNERGWSQRELARRTGEISQSTVSNVLSGKNPPTWEFCAAIAGPLGVPLDDVLILAGLKPAPPAPVPEENVALAALRTMSEAERKVAVKMLQAVGSVPAGRGVNEPAIEYQTNYLELFEFYEVAEQLARLPDGPIRDEAMASIRAIADSAEKRAGASSSTAEERNNESKSAHMAGTDPHLAPG
jgi:transcriptional regulator with XRE-family HTH domain